MPTLLFARPPKDSAEERQIRQLVGARRAPADHVRRAKIIALSWSGERVQTIAARLGCAEKTVRYRLNRFNSEGLDGLENRPGAGRKPRITEAQRSQIVALARRPPAEHRSRSGTTRSSGANPRAGSWTLDALTEAVRGHGIDIHRSQVRRILLASGTRAPSASRAHQSSPARAGPA